MQNPWDIWKILYEQSWIKCYIYINFASNTPELFPMFTLIYQRTELEISTNTSLQSVAMSPKIFGDDFRRNVLQNKILPSSWQQFLNLFLCIGDTFDRFWSFFETNLKIFWDYFALKLKSWWQIWPVTLNTELHRIILNYTELYYRITPNYTELHRIILPNYTII